MWDSRFVVSITLLAVASSASGLSESDSLGRDTLGSASAFQYRASLNEQWEDIVSSLDRKDAPHEHHCWPQARLDEPSAAAGASAQHGVDPSAPSGFELDLTEASLVAELQTTVYCNRTHIQAWDCTRCRNVSSFEVQELVFIDDWDVTALVGRWPLLDAAFVTFRGTDSHNLGNWVADMDLRMVEYPLFAPRTPRPARTAEGLRVATAGSLRSELSGEVGASAGTAREDTPGVDEDMPRVHSGFLRSLVDSDLYQGVHDALGALAAANGGTQQRLFVTGHSLGGAMAALAAPMLRRDFSPPEMRLYTFGCPRTGNQAFVDLLMDTVDYSVRFTHSHDIVPSLPPPFFGFRHFPREVWQIDDPPTGQSEAGQNVSDATRHLESFVLHPSQQDVQDPGGQHLNFACGREGSAAKQNFTFKICDGSGEDLECHDSLCYWAPCHSLVDHVHYLGKHMYHKAEEC